MGQGSPGSHLFPGKVLASVSLRRCGPSFKPGLRSSQLGRDPGPSFGSGIPSGLAKGSSDWQRAYVTSGPPRRPLPPEARGGSRRRGGARGPGGFRVSPQPEPAAGRRRRNSPRTDFFPLVPNPPPAPPPPHTHPELQLLGWQMRRLNPPSWSLRRANRLETMVCVCVLGRGRGVDIASWSSPFPASGRRRVGGGFSCGPYPKFKYPPGAPGGFGCNW